VTEKYDEFLNYLERRITTHLFIIISVFAIIIVALSLIVLVYKVHNPEIIAVIPVLVFGYLINRYNIRLARLARLRRNWVNSVSYYKKAFLSIIIGVDIGVALYFYFHGLNLARLFLAVSLTFIGFLAIQTPLYSKLRERRIIISTILAIILLLLVVLGSLP